MKFTLTHIRLLVQNFPETAAFYKDVLALELAWGDGSPPYVSFRAGNALLSLFERRLMSEAINNSAKPFDAESQDNGLRPTATATALTPLIPLSQLWEKGRSY